MAWITKKELDRLSLLSLREDSGISTWSAWAHKPNPKHKWYQFWKSKYIYKPVNLLTKEEWEKYKKE